MKIISKYKCNLNNNFEWIDFDYLPSSKGYKFEVYPKVGNNYLDNFVKCFHILFDEFLDKTLIKPFGSDSNWGSFCIDTWNINNEQFDYSIDNKTEPTKSYLNMLKSSEIEPNYTGFCSCSNWSKFLQITFFVVLNHRAPYSMMFYEYDSKFVTYFHHSGSFGIYFKELNNGVKKIINKALENEMEIKNNTYLQILS